MKYKNILITGATGSLGQSLTNFIIKNFNINRLVIFSRDELKQYEMKKKYTKRELDKMRFFLGDIRDKERLSIACSNIDLVIHAAALKQVDTAEYNPIEYVKTNIIGAQNLIEVCHNSKIKKVIAVSTDKASSPVNLYGATKLCSDKLFLAANNYITNTIFSVIKYGNVISSRGSVIPILAKQFKDKKSLTVTNEKMTRFTLELNKCLNVISWSAKNSHGGEIIIPKLKSYRILDVVKAITDKANTKIIGIRPGEKLHEEMISINESRYCYDIGNYFILIPSLAVKTIKYYKKKFKAKLVNEKFEYNSKNNSDFLSVNELKKIISRNL